MAKKLEEAFEIRFAKMPPPPPQAPTTPAGTSTAMKQNGSLVAPGMVSKRRDSSQSTHTNKTSSPSNVSVNNLTPNSTTSKAATKLTHAQSTNSNIASASGVVNKRKPNLNLQSKLGN